MSSSSSPARPLARAGWAWALVVAFAVHNVEEAATMEAFLSSGAGGLGDRLGVGPSLLAPFLVAVTALTVAALVLAVLATVRRPAAWVTEALRVLAVVMVVNVLLPHVPAAVITGGYVPGLVTAVLVNLPVAVLFLRHARRPARTG